MRVGLCARVAVAVAAGGIVAGLIAGWAAGRLADDRIGLLVRASLTLVTVVVVPWVAVRRAVLVGHRTELVACATLGVALGYALDPYAWSGTGFVAAWWTDGFAAWATDLALCVGIGAASAARAARHAARRGQSLSYQR